MAGIEIKRKQEGGMPSRGKKKKTKRVKNGLSYFGSESKKKKIPPLLNQMFLVGNKFD